MSKRLIRRQDVLVKIEATEGTDPTPAAANAVRMAGAGTLEIGAEVQNPRDDVITGTLDRLQPLPPTAQFGELSFDMQLRGFGAAYSATNLPEGDPIYRAAGLAATVVVTPGSETVTYETASTSLETCAVYFYLDEKLWKLLACRADVGLRFPAGGPGLLNVRLRGLLTKAADATFVAGSFQTATPPVGTSLAVTYNAVTTLIVREFGATLGNQIVPRLSANAAAALAGYMITSRDSRFTLRCEDPLVATVNFESDWSAATARAISCVLGATQYNRVKFNADKATIAPAPRFEDDAGLSIANIEGAISNEGTARWKVLYD